MTKFFNLKYNEISITADYGKHTIVYDHKITDLDHSDLTMTTNLLNTYF